MGKVMVFRLRPLFLSQANKSGMGGGGDTGALVRSAHLAVGNLGSVVLGHSQSLHHAFYLANFF